MSRKMIPVITAEVLLGTTAIAAAQTQTEGGGMRATGSALR